MAYRSPKDIADELLRDFFTEITVSEDDPEYKKAKEAVEAEFRGDADSVEALRAKFEAEYLANNGAGEAGNASGQGGNPGQTGNPGGSGAKSKNMPGAAEADKNATQEQAAEAEKAAKEPETDPMEDLEALVGMSNLKKDVVELANLMKFEKLRESRGMKTVAISKHLVFTGNPGTGKTTVARILARLYKQIGVLSKGQLVECDRSGLVAGFVGQTAMKTQEVIEKAMGGVLFIDEAYTLAKEGNDFGQEAIDTLLKAMEDHRDDLIVIVAGYDKPMEKFIDSNPGLKSRFNKYFHFDDYSADELMQIFDGLLKRNDYVLDENARKLALKHIEDSVANKGDNFANARDVRNYFEHIVNKQASRVMGIAEPTDEDIRTFTVDDLKVDQDVFHWAFIGAGVLAEIVAEQLVNSEKHDIAAVYTHTPEKGKAFAEKYQCTAYASALEAMQDKNVDGIYIVTPHTSHYEYAKMAIECGKPVLVEKPFTIKASETEELIALAKEKKVYLAEAMWTWFSPIAQQVKAWVQFGALGTITSVSINFHNDVKNYAPRLLDPSKAGGALLDSGVYPLTYIYRLFGEPSEIRCEGKVENGIDPGEAITLVYKNDFSEDLVIPISVSIMDGEGGNTLRIEGTEGSIELPNLHFADRVTLKHADGTEETLEEDGSYLNEFNMVAGEILDGGKESIFVPLESTLAVMKMMDTCREQLGLKYPFEEA